MLKIFYFLFISLLVFGCAKKEDSTSSSDDSSSGSITLDDSSSGSIILSGKIAQGYVRGAKVFADVDGDGIRDSNESQATSDTSGSYDLKADPGSWMLITSGGTFLDSKGNEVNALPMKAPAPTTSGATSNVTPLTSLVAANPSLKAKLDALGGDGWNADIASSSGVPGKLLRIAQTVEQTMMTLSTGSNAVLTTDSSKLKTLDKLADAFAMQENISSNEALAAATQEGLLNALNDENVVILSADQKKIKGALVDATLVAVDSVTAAISDTSEAVVETSVASTLETALDNATSVVGTALNLASNPKYAKFCGGSSLTDISSCPSIDDSSYLAVARFGYVVYSE